MHPRENPGYACLFLVTLKLLNFATCVCNQILLISVVHRWTWLSHAPISHGRRHALAHVQLGLRMVYTRTYNIILWC